MSELKSVLSEVAAERERQRGKGFDAALDDRKPLSEWFQDIQDWTAWSRAMHGMGSPDRARRRLIQVAALAVAAVESLDRRIAE